MMPERVEHCGYAVEKCWHFTDVGARYKDEYTHPERFLIIKRREPTVMSWFDVRQ